MGTIRAGRRCYAFNSTQIAISKRFANLNPESTGAEIAVRCHFVTRPAGNDRPHVTPIRYNPYTRRKTLIS